MQLRMLDKAFAAANLASLGWRPQEIKEITCDWIKRQTAQSMERFVKEASRLSEIDELGPDCSGRMFLSFHYSVYPNLYRAIGRKAANFTIYSLIGHQGPDHCKSLQAMAHMIGINIHFVQSGFRMVHEMKEGLKKGHAGIILLDIPWSKTEAIPDRQYAAFGGSFSSLSTVERLVDIIDERREVVTVTRDINDKVRLTRLGNLRFSDAYSRLGELIERDPADYERLHQFHRFFSFESYKSVLITFRIKDQRYALLGPSMRTIKLDHNITLDRAEATDHGICDDQKLTNALRRAIGGDFDLVLCL